MLTKLLILFVMWIGIGIVGMVWKAVTFRNKVVSIDRDNSKRIFSEAVSMLSHGNVNGSDSVKEAYHKTNRSLERNLWIEFIRQAIVWPDTLAKLDAMHNDIYEHLNDKYGQARNTLSQ